MRNFGHHQGKNVPTETRIANKLLTTKQIIDKADWNVMSTAQCACHIFCIDLPVFSFSFETEWAGSRG